MSELPKDTIYHYKSDGLNVTITMTELVRCKDCFYYVPEVDDPHRSNCQRLWGGMIECEPDSYCSDAFPKKRRTKMIYDFILDELVQIWAQLPNDVEEVDINLKQDKGIEIKSEMGYEFIPIQPVRRAHWIDHNDAYECSHCHNRAWDTTESCPNCGSRMK